MFTSVRPIALEFVRLSANGKDSLPKRCTLILLPGDDKAYFKWRYTPTPLSDSQKAFFSKLITAIQEKKLHCIEWGLIPKKGPFELNKNTVHILRDTIISHEAYNAFAEEIPGAVKVEAKDKSGPENIQDEKMPVEEFLKSIKDVVQKIYNVSYGQYGENSLANAVAYLEKNPSEYILPKYL
jgi:hypothetical protein